MKRFIIPLIEGLALLSSVVFGVLWIKTPQGPYEPPFAISGLIFVATELFRRYKEKLFPAKIQDYSKLDINSKNTLVARFISSGNSKSDYMCLAFYGMKIVNTSNEPYTVKDVILRYQLKGKEYSDISYVVITGTIFAPLDKKEKNALIIHSNGDSIVCMGWNNLRTEIGKHNVIPAGGVLSGSAIFILEAKNIDEVSEVTNLEIVVTDYSGNESIHSLKILDEWINHGRKLVIEPKQFTSDKDGNIAYA
jgi:hypothetical protein